MKIRSNFFGTFKNDYILHDINGYVILFSKLCIDLEIEETSAIFQIYTIFKIMYRFGNIYFL